MKRELDKRGILSIVLCTILTLVLVANYFAYILGNKQEKIGAYQFDKFQEDSEYLVYAKIAVNKRNIDNKGYGLSNVERIEGQVRPSQWSLFNNPEVEIKPYLSQVGLQGYIFSFLYNNLNFSTEVLYIINCTLMAIVVMAICILLGKKYNKLMSIVFYIVFLLSPWICAFARNLYWVEFTWFIPMLLGLILSINQKKRKIIVPLMFLAVFAKCLCGYEYISTIMMSSIAFLIADWFTKKESRKETFKSIFLVTIACVLAFIAALTIHASIRGNGNIGEGLKEIYEKEVSERTYTTNYENLDKLEVKAAQSNPKDVVQRYFKWKTEIIRFIPGNTFLALIITSIVVLVVNLIRKKEGTKKDLVLFIYFILSTISWFILAKAHSYVHTHMNFVLWYFGFVQMIFYIIIDFVVDILKLIINKIRKVEKVNDSKQIEEG